MYHPFYFNIPSTHIPIPDNLNIMELNAESINNMFTRGITAEGVHEWVMADDIVEHYGNDDMMVKYKGSNMSLKDALNRRAIEEFMKLPMEDPIRRMVLGPSGSSEVYNIVKEFRVEEEENKMSAFDQGRDMIGDA